MAQSNSLVCYTFPYFQIWCSASSVKQSFYHLKLLTYRERNLRCCWIHGFCHHLDQWLVLNIRWRQWFEIFIFKYRPSHLKIWRNTFFPPFIYLYLSLSVIKLNFINVWFDTMTCISLMFDLLEFQRYFWTLTYIFIMFLISIAKIFYGCINFQELFKSYRRLCRKDLTRMLSFYLLLARD